MKSKTSALCARQATNKISFPAWWKTLLVILVAGSTSWAAIYFEKGIGFAIVLIPFISFTYWCDEANITWKSSPVVKSMLFLLMVALTVTYLLGASEVSRLIHHKKPLFESGWMYELASTINRITG